MYDTLGIGVRTHAPISVSSLSAGCGQRDITEAATAFYWAYDTRRVQGFKG